MKKACECCESPKGIGSYLFCIEDELICVGKKQSITRTGDVERFTVNYCPICGKKLKEVPHNPTLEKGGVMPVDGFKTIKGHRFYIGRCNIPYGSLILCNLLPYEEAYPLAECAKSLFPNSRVEIESVYERETRTTNKYSLRCVGWHMRISHLLIEEINALADCE